MQSVAKKRVGILRGGTGEYYASSLQKGGDIISHINENLSDRWKPVDILIDRDYVWHINGLPANPSDLVHKVDVVWNTSHPTFSNVLESLSIPNVSAPAFSSVLENSGGMLREHMKQIGVSMPRHIILPVYQKDFDGPREKYAIKKAKEIFEKFSSPWIVKSLMPDIDIGIHVAKTFNELVQAIENGVKQEKSILIEEFVAGKALSMHSISGFRGEDVYIFPLGNIFGKFSSPEKEKLVNLGRDLHNHTGAGHYLRSDFILHPRGKVYLLSIESNPDLKQDSHFSQSCELAGAKMQHIIEHILERALV